MLAEGTVNWVTGSERLWNEVEAAETRKNSRVAREIRVAIPAELPLDDMRRLMHGYCCNLKDRYGMVTQYAIHTPAFRDREDGKEVQRRYRDGEINLDEYLLILSDPKRTNLNFHAHILCSNRQKDLVDGGFGLKIRCLDNIKTGPEEIQTIRAEWETRTNAALRRIGSKARIDLRSYQDMAAAGDAPEGLTPQTHLGPKAANAAKDKHAKDDKADASKQPCVEDTEPFTAIETLVEFRQETKKQNDDIWPLWLLRRDQERQKARLEESVRISTKREADRKKEAASEKDKILNARGAEEAHAAAAEAAHLAAPRGSLADIIARVQSGEEMSMPAEEDHVIDPETYQRAASTTPFEEPIRIRQVSRVRIRTRTG